MKLYYSTGSPFSRKANILLHLTGLIEQTELVVTNPLENTGLRAINPLGKVPTLVDGDQVFADSSLICEYLDDKAGTGLNHKGRDDYYTVQRVQVLANGILEAAVATLMEKRRTTEHSRFWLDRWATAIHTALSECRIAQIGSVDDPHMGTIALATALGYLDFRQPEYDWRTSFPDLDQWLQAFEKAGWYCNTKPF